ncbi:MAG: DUF2306 domain-containing protein [Pseudomonadales bacterium]|nr:DUF2306 domain-containing protein [Pseudomonadales bacterium]
METTQENRWLGKTGLVLMIISSLAIGLYAFGFQARMVGAPEFHMKFDASPLAAAMHVIGGGTVLLVGGFQFVGALRRSYPQLHRWFGRIYLSFVFIGGIGGLVLATTADGGLVAKVGFGMLAVLWLFSGWQALAAIRRGDVQTHKAWMARNYAMAFGAVTLRIYLGMFTALQIPFEEGYPVVAWLSWVPNLILVEWWMALSSQTRAARKSITATPIDTVSSAV